MSLRLLRAAAAITKNAGTPYENAELISQAVKEANKKGADIVLSPALAVSGVSLDSLFLSSSVLNGCKTALRQLCELSVVEKTVIAVGAPFVLDGVVLSGCFVISDGVIKGIVPDLMPPAPFASVKQDFIGQYNFEGQDIPVSANLLFTIDEFKIGIETGLTLFSYESSAKTLIEGGADIILNPSYYKGVPQIAEKVKNFSKYKSEIYSCGYATCSNGLGESTYKYVYKGFAGLFECGNVLSFIEQEENITLAFSDFDLDIIEAVKRKKRDVLSESNCTKILCKSDIENKNSLMRPLLKNPFLTGDSKKDARLLTDYFDLQVCSLAGRLSNAGINAAVIGVSGGLDSALSLLVTVSAFKRLSLPLTDIRAVMLPCLGTTERTSNNALALVNSLGVTVREVDIKKAVEQHFCDINHDIDDKNNTYENAQARERMQVLFDIANDVNGVVVGTGDLSEIALGWCTFGGDHLTGYNVNGCITKTMARLIVSHIAENSNETVKNAIDEILGTPASPELLPADVCLQETESIIGPFELHDFFLYYLIKYGFMPEKILFYAKQVFSETYSDNEIKRWLNLFTKRFVLNQFKRSCSSEGACIGEVCLSPSAYSFPSDLNGKIFNEL